MLHALLTFAADAVEEAEPSKVPFYIAGSLLALWALVVSAIGISRNREFPPSAGAARGVMGISAVLVVAAMATAVITG
jgi:hypothetical protein